LLFAGFITNGCIKVACLDAKHKEFSVILISERYSTFHKDGENIVSYWNIYLR